MQIEQDASNSNMLPSARYMRGVQQGQWNDDPTQHGLLAILDRIHTELLTSIQTRRTPWRFFAQKQMPKRVKGVYVWGGVGRGKTWLIDLFFQGVPIAQKQRMHFHDFMQNMHALLKLHARQPDPLRQIAQELGATTRLLFLDEFIVEEIGDAMVLAEILKQVCHQHICLVTSSNTPPHALYENGLQRENFLPAIDLLTQHCQIMHMDGTKDYRKQADILPEHVFVGSPQPAKQWLLAQWHQAVGCVPQADVVTINGRELAVQAMDKNAVWFSFSELCVGKRSTIDYSAIARRFNCIFIEQIPCFTRHNEDAALRFIYLIDVLYAQNMRFFCTLETEPAVLYCGTRHTLAFTRAVSRLLQPQQAASSSINNTLTRP